MRSAVDLIISSSTACQYLGQPSLIKPHAVSWKLTVAIEAIPGIVAHVWGNCQAVV